MRRFPGIGAWVSARPGHDQPLSEMRPAERVLRRFRGHETAVGELDARDGTSRFERHAQARRAGWHGGVPRFAPGDLDEVRTLDADEVPADLEAVQHYNPGVRHAAIEGALRTGVGARRSCELLPKGRIVERVTHWEDGRAVGLELDEHDWPIDFMRWVTRIEPHGRGTRITQSLEYQVTFGPLGWLLDQIVMKRKLTATLDAVFASLARHAQGSGADDKPIGRS